MSVRAQYTTDRVSWRVCIALSLLTAGADDDDADDWNFLIGFYFCFITLSTIGFGDYVPGTRLDTWAAQEKLILCALYLLIGLALLAMCFELIQEEVRLFVRSVGIRMGLVDAEKEWTSTAPGEIRRRQFQELPWSHNM